jgi:hypothetical protein
LAASWYASHTKFLTPSLGLILGARIATPFFQRPADVVAYALPAAFSALLAPVSESKTPYVQDLQYGLLIFYGTVLAVAFLAIALKDAKSVFLLKVSEAFRQFSARVGAPIVIFGPLTFFALYAFHYGDPGEFLPLSLAAISLILLSPFEALVISVRKLRGALTEISGDAIGEIVGIQLPGIVLVRGGGRMPEHGQILPAKDPYCPSGRLMALDVVGRDEGLLLRTLLIPEDGAVSASHSSAGLRTGAVGMVPLNERAPLFINVDLRDLCGIVAIDSSVSQLNFEVTKSEGLSVGRLLSAHVAGEKVLYQLLDGVTKEEVVQQKNTFGYVRASARQVGAWDVAAQAFKASRWVAAPNAPVFLEQDRQEPLHDDAVGHFPGSTYPVRMSDLDALVTHNCAILGVLGVGKSTLAFVLIERLLRAGKKVLALDITGQYRVELRDYVAADQDAFERRLADAAAHGRADWDEAPSLGGSIEEFRRVVLEEIDRFMSPECEDLLMIIDPMRLDVSKQLYEPKNVNINGGWVRSAQLQPVTPVEVTRIVSESALKVLSSEFSPEARLCLVYEEAHSLVPEWTSIVAEGDKSAVSGTARAVLQGRKYGLGCMVVSQRTANVTKTILNQCSTVFAMRSFDDTSKDFLSNYIGGAYASVLPELADRQAVVFGRASSCVNPVS